MSMPANNLRKHEEKWYTHSHGRQSNVENQSLKRPRMITSKVAMEAERSSTFVPQPPCFRFKRGMCGHGDKCRYAHTTGSLYVPWRGHGVEDQRDLHHLKYCHYFYSGKECPYGNQCRFLHEYNHRYSSAINIATSGHEVKNKAPCGTLEPKKSVDLVKTKFCIKWRQTGSCFYGSNCQFVHGKAELPRPGSSTPQESCSSAGIFAPAKNAASDELGFKALRKRGLLSWNVRKIGEIYADWIEGMLLIPVPSHTLKN